MVKHNKYERAIMSNIILMKGLFGAIVVFNFFLPIYRPFSLGIGSLFQWIVVGIHFSGLLNGIGYFSQRLFVGPVLLVRVLEILWYVYISRKTLNWIPFGLILFMDLFFLLILFMDRLTYKYERVTKE